MPAAAFLAPHRLDRPGAVLALAHDLDLALGQDAAQALPDELLVACSSGMALAESAAS